MKIESWFPIPRDQIEDEVFSKLTPTEKLYYWLIVSEFNLTDGEGFYRADDWFAAALRLSTPKIRQARRKFMKLDLINVNPGMKDKNGRNLTTTYISVKWSFPQEGEQFAQMHRYTFDVLLNCLRIKDLSHEDVILYVYLSYLFGIKGGKYVNITKSELCKITGMPKAHKYVENLYKGFTFTGGDHLFKYEDNYRLLVFTEREIAAYNAENLKKYQENINKLVAEARTKEAEKQKAKAKQKSKVSAEDLEDSWRYLYYERYHKKAQLVSQEKQGIKLLGEKEDPAIVEYAMRIYIYSNKGNGRNTLSGFLAHPSEWLNSAKAAIKKVKLNNVK